MRDLNNKGIGLVEAIIAIAFAVVLVVTLLGLTAFNAQNATNVSSRQDAVTQTSTQIERLKYLKDSNFNNFYTKVSLCASTLDVVYPCTVGEDGAIVTGCPADASGCFGATITTTPSEDLTVNSQSKAYISEINIDLISFYYVNKTKFSTATSTLFTNWRTRQWGNILNQIKVLL